jgi:hypothetical protein
MFAVYHLDLSIFKSENFLPNKNNGIFSLNRNHWKGIFLASPHAQSIRA